MRFLILLTVSLALFIDITAQRYYPIPPAKGESLPAWAHQMLQPNPNVWEIDAGYSAWRLEHPGVKTTYSQYYKKWRRANEPFVNNQGFIQKPSHAEEQEFLKRLQKLKQQSERSSGNWTVLGPVETFSTNQGPNPLAQSSQVNVYCFDQSISNPDVIYCGTEGGEIYKSEDHGQHWFSVSRNYAIGAPGAIEVHPYNHEIVFAGENDRLRRSLNGGDTWEIVLQEGNMVTHDIKFHPGFPDTILAATQVGLYRSEDGGSSWFRLKTEACYDLEWKTDDSSVVFLVRNDPALGICRFEKSYDGGLTWEVKDNGWFFSDEEGRNDGGARLAVTDADPNRVYAVLIGEARTGDSGFIGVWRSDDAGESWTLPNPPAGGPWNADTHPNMATISRTEGYHQGFYNLGFDASDINPDFVMAGFLSLWYSTDGGATFTCNGGYCGNDFHYVHPDCQEIEINGNEIWMTSDGGIEFSDDFFTTHYALNRGITGSDYWGFGTGWNEDILVGGRYHNGNSGWYETWMPGECLSLGGGEAPTGYVNPGSGRKTYYSDIGGVILPETQNGIAQYFSLGKYPTESYVVAESGEMEWEPTSWNVFYVTHENKLWRTSDGGSSWEILHEFGTDVQARTLHFEISRSDPRVMYLFQADEYYWDPGILWKSVDHGESWEQLLLPPGYARRALLAVDAEDANRLWLAYSNGDHGQKVYTSYTGGTSWENITTDALNGEGITYIMHQGGTDGGLYVGSYRTIWFRDDTMDEWLPFADGLPVSISTCILRPFYRDQKIRLGAYGKGIWESPFAVPSRPVAQPMVSKTISSCPGDTIRFDDFSMLAHEGAVWSWEFPGGTPSVSDLRNPLVVYNTPGKYDVTLTVSNPFGTSSKTIPEMVEILSPVINDVPPLISFMGDDASYYTILNPDDTITWQPMALNTCEGEGDTVMYVHNYIYSAYGIDEIQLPANLDLTAYTEPVLTFQVAYAPYYDGNAFIDSLKVRISGNCGESYQTIFRSGGEELSTTTSGQGPNNLYEYEEFTPQSCEEWRTITLNLKEYAGRYVTLGIVNQSGYGNNMYVDDILIEELEPSSVKTLSIAPLMLVPNPANAFVQVSGDMSSDGPAVLSLTNATGEVVLSRRIEISNGRLHEYVGMQGMLPGFYVVTAEDQHRNVLRGKLILQY